MTQSVCLGFQGFAVLVEAGGRSEHLTRRGARLLRYRVDAGDVGGDFPGALCRHGNIARNLRRRGASLLDRGAIAVAVSLTLVNCWLSAGHGGRPGAI